MLYEPISFLDYLAGIPVGLAGLVWWWLFSRGRLTTAFCLWFPTVMVVLLAPLLWLDALHAAPSPVMEVVFPAVVVMNLPGLLLVLPGVILLEQLPSAATMPVAAALFWISWYIVLCLLRRRAQWAAPTCLKLS
jgi:hypothetical protein